VLTAKSALDTNRVRINCTLPVNYAYALDNLYTKIVITDGPPGDANGIDNFESIAMMNVVSGMPNSAATNSEMLSNGGFVHANDMADGAKIWTSQSLPRHLFFNSQGTAPAVRVFLKDPDATNATNAGTMNFTCTILQYDLEQAYYVAVNAPIPVRTT